MNLLRWLTAIAGALTAIPIGIFVLLALRTTISTSGAFYLLALSLAIIGAISMPWRGRGAIYLHALFWVGLGLFAAVALVRIVTVRPSGNLRMITLPGEGEARWINRLVEEQDVTLFGLRPMLAMRMVTRREAEDAVPAFLAPYEEIRNQAAGAMPSPFPATYLFLQRPTAFDAIIVEPTGESASTTAVIFLHGFAGNFTLQCWLFAKAASTAGMLTICPSTSWIGDWWSADGEATLRQTIQYLRRQGIERIYLAGLSNGGFGASELAPRLSDELAGLIFISGVEPNAADTGLPVLLIHGDGDERIPISLARNYAARIGDQATLVEFPGDHFLLAKDAAAVQQTITDWLLVHEQQGR
jgi:pimeloyl-ACP methyl ester carboxylesterase